MIHVYTDKQNSEGWILQNDWYFNIYTGNEDFSEKEKEAIWQIDHAKLTGDKHIETKYGLGTVRNLSSGCKTLLNVMKNPDKVVNADECGKNVLDMLFAMDGIYLYMSRPERIHIADGTEICFNEKDIVVGRRGYEQWWSGEYERRDMDDL
ncbi:MAG: DUF4869 domain-containing protein [Lachnospiraceae bacterium]|nr:DUF4869 domain-containing protein [Lachnospiraceae bacterium]